MAKRSPKSTINNKIQNPSRKVRQREKSEFSTSENPVIFVDKINLEILKSITKNPDIKSSEISEKIDIPDYSKKKE